MPYRHLQLPGDTTINKAESLVYGEPRLFSDYASKERLSVDYRITNWHLIKKEMVRWQAVLTESLPKLTTIAV